MCYNGIVDAGALPPPVEGFPLSVARGDAPALAYDTWLRRAMLHIDLRDYQGTEYAPTQAQRDELPAREATRYHRSRELG